MNNAVELILMLFLNHIDTCFQFDAHRLTPICIRLDQSFTGPILAIVINAIPAVC